MNNFGLIYEKEGKEYLYKSYRTLEEIVLVLQSDEFISIKKDKVIVVQLVKETSSGEEPTTSKK